MPICSFLSFSTTFRKVDSVKLAFGLENIRRISSTPQIELRPITILVGRNSAGKSTFLRSLPLIRQSLETRSSAPILWFGDLVDFGDPNVAIGEGKSTRQAAFRFTLNDIWEEKGRSPYYFYYIGRPRSRTPVRVSSVSVRYVIGVREERTVLEAIQIEIPEEGIDVEFRFDSSSESAGSILIDGELRDVLPKAYAIRKPGWNLFSPPWFVPRSLEWEGRRSRWPMQSVEVLVDILIEMFSDEIARSLSEKTYRKEAWRLLSEDRLDSNILAKLASTAATVSFKELYGDLLSDMKSEFAQGVVSIHKLSRVLAILELIDEQLTAYFLNVGYLEPVRAASERFYRKQELAVSEIAPNGANFPMFLASLDKEELAAFSGWVEGIFGYGVTLHTTGGHISVLLKSGNRAVNVTDTGYGVSQILPVLGMIWWAQNVQPLSGTPLQPRREMRRTGGRLRTLAIEQPELHLHPAHQAKLADVFVSVAGRERRGGAKSETRLVVETHSEALVQRLGELIEEGKVDSDAVQIVIFSANEDLDSPTEVSVSRFDGTGALTNWPFGFFNYSAR